LYACKIKEAANGGWRRACGEARETFEVVTQRSVETDGEIDERKTIARIRENKAQEIAEKKAALKIGEA
jgi:hypothetical protein